jgi:hypothetical protein
MSDAPDPAAAAHANLEHVLSRHVLLRESTVGREHIEGVREGLAQVDAQLRAAVEEAENAANGTLGTAERDELRRAIELARHRLGDGDVPEETDKPDRFEDHTGTPRDPLEYAREQLCTRDLEALVARPEDTRILYALERTGGRRIHIGGAKDVRSLRVIADRLWDHGIVPKCAAKNYWAVQQALLCIKRDEPGVTAEQITRGWLAGYVGQETPDRACNLGDPDDRALLAGASEDPPPAAVWVIGGKLGAQRRLLVHSASLDQYVRRQLGQPLARGNITGRLRAVGFDDFKVREVKTAHRQDDRAERRWWISPAGFTLEGDG